MYCHLSNSSIIPCCLYFAYGAVGVIYFWIRLSEWDVQRGIIKLMVFLQIMALLGIILYVGELLIGQLIPYQTGIGVTMFVFSFVIATIFRAVDGIIAASATKAVPKLDKKKISPGMVILALGVVLGLGEWSGANGTEGFEGIGAALWSYFFIVVGGLLVVFKK